MNLISKYQDFDHLTTAMANELIDKIIVYDRDRKGIVGEWIVTVIATANIGLRTFINS